MPELVSLLIILMTFLPLATALAILLGQRRGEDARSPHIALAGAILTLAISLYFAPRAAFHPGKFVFGYTAEFPLIPSLHLNFALNMDELSLLLILLTNVLSVLSILGSWTAITRRRKEFYFYLLALQTGIIGTFLASNLVLFYIFWELMLIPLYFLIGIFGSGNRIYATTKFFLFTFAGSVLMLIGILALYHQSAAALKNGGSFELSVLLQATRLLTPAARLWIFLSFLLAFMIKVPLFPLHTWLPDAHTEAPTAGSVMLAGVLLKTGVYGLMRFAIPLFPGEALLVAPYINALAVIAIIYGALTAFAQSDMKRLVAYSSVSHMGFIVLGLFSFQPQAVAGAALQMINHGISTGGLFLCVGYLYERRHTRELSAFGGLAHNMKLFAVLTMLMVLSSVGLPGLNGFVGEFLILIGAFQAKAWWAIAGAAGVILAACYLLRMMQGTFFGALDKDENKKLLDLNLREAFTLIVLAIGAFWIGVRPNPMLKALDPAASTVMDAIHSQRPAPVVQTAAPAPVKGDRQQANAKP